MTSSNIQRRRYSGSTLGVVVFAWLAVLMMPCAMGFNLDASTTAPTNSAAISGAHDKCPGSTHGDPTDLSDCCCDLTDVPGVKSPEIPELSAVLAFPIETVVSLPLMAGTETVNRRFLAFHTTSPPVYLATQRLRI